MIDAETSENIMQNSYLVSAINLHNVPKGRNYECVLAKDLSNFNFQKDSGRHYGLVFVEG